MIELYKKCPYCNEPAKGLNITHEDTSEKVEDYLLFKRTFKYYCPKCQNRFELDGGIAELRRYNPPVPDTCCNDVMKYVSYESEFDTSYSIVSVNDVYMIIQADDRYPIIISEEDKDKLINSHELTRRLTCNKWMDRYR